MERWEGAARRERGSGARWGRGLERSSNKPEAGRFHKVATGATGDWQLGSSEGGVRRACRTFARPTCVISNLAAARVVAAIGDAFEGLWRFVQWAAVALPYQVFEPG